MDTSNLDTLIMSPSDLELSEVDRRKPSKIEDHHHCNLSPPTPDINISHQLTKDQEKNKDANSGVSGGLKIQIVTSFSNDDHPKTPKSREHKIPAMSVCPPAPRKVSKSTGKRKASFFVAVGDQYSAADFRVYVDAMLALNEVVYVPDIVVGDLGAGDCAKRLKTSLADQP